MQGIRSDVCEGDRMNPFWTSVITSSAVVSLGGCMLYWIFTKWIGARIEHSIKHEYDKSLEEYKIKLQNDYIKQFNKYGRMIATDELLFKEFLNDFPSGYAIEQVRHWTGRFFHSNSLELLDILMHKWSLVDHQFLHCEIENARASLILETETLESKISCNIQPSQINPNLYEIPYEWTIDKPIEYRAILKSIFDQRDVFIRSYDDLVKIARSILKC